MSTVDPLKQKSVLPPLDLNPPTKADAAKKKPVDLDYVPPAPPLQVNGLFPSTATQGPGVSASVFGPVSPDPKALGDAELAKKTSQLFATIKANPGKANAYDLKLAGAMVAEMGRRANDKLSAPVDPTKLGNGELFQRLLLVDLKKQAGPLSKAEADNAAKLEAEWKKRTANDPTKQLAEAQAKREALKKEIAFQCGTAAAGALGIAPLPSAVGLLGSAVMVYHEASQGHYGAAGLEVATTGAALLLHGTPWGIGVEIVAAGVNLAKCGALIKDLHDADQHLKDLSSVAKGKP